MSFKLFPSKIAKFYSNLSLQSIITVPFLLQIFVTVGLVGYLSWRNGEQAVNKVTSQLRKEVSAGVSNHLKDYLEKPHLIVKLKQKSSQLDRFNFADFSSTERDFWSTIQLFDSVRAIYMGDKNGKFIYIKQEENKFYTKEVTQVPERKTYALDNFGQRQEITEIDEYDLRKRPWYTKTERLKRNNWSNIYTFTGGELGITASGFLKNSQGVIKGIVGVDLILSGIGNFLQEIEISENGQVFIVEKDGYLVATSTDEAPFTYDRLEQKEKRLLATESQNKLTQATANHLIENYNGLLEIKQPELLDFQLKGERQLVQVLPYQDGLGLDWSIVVVIPEKDFMAEIHANTRNTIGLCLMALAIACMVGIYTSRRIARPIASLSQVSDMIAQSAKARKTATNFYPVVEAKSIKELQLLGQSFNEMVKQLKTAFRDLENTNEELEIRVKQRTKDLSKAKEAADRANRAKSEFLANMSHELRTPLHAILGFTQISRQDSTLSPQQAENLATVQRSGEHLLALINDVLAMSQLETGSVCLEEKAFDLHLSLENMAKMFRLRLARLLDKARSQKQNLQLIFEIANDVPQHVKTDPVKLHQVLINLIENGIKYTAKGKVIVRVKLAENNADKNRSEIVFTVQDNGCGIAPKEIDSIFEPFTQNKPICDREGTGLGLAISQQFVRLLGGEIKVNSLLGKGSVFQFQIPVTVIEERESAPNLVFRNSRHNSNSADLPTQSQQILLPISNLSTLASMSAEWIQKLQQAAIEVDSDSILQLIQQIPASDRNLAKELKKMLKHFQYDEIIELTEIVSR